MRDPRALIDTNTLAASLGDPSLRVFDCTTYLEPTPAGSAEPYNAVPGRKTFEEGHVPGADFLDLQGEFSATDTHLHFMMPPVAKLEAALGRYGIGAGTRVVLYSIGTMMWATRFWWMLRSLGFDNAAVLDGGLDKWKTEGRPLETGAPHGYPPASFVAKPREGLFVDASKVKAAIGRGDYEAAYRHASDLSPAGTLAPYTPHALWVAMDPVEAAERTNRHAEALAHVEAMREADFPATSPRLSGPGARRNASRAGSASQRSSA